MNQSIKHSILLITILLAFQRLSGLPDCFCTLVPNSESVNLLYNGNMSGSYLSSHKRTIDGKSIVLNESYQKNFTNKPEKEHILLALEEFAERFNGLRDKQEALRYFKIKNMPIMTLTKLVVNEKDVKMSESEVNEYIEKLKKDGKLPKNGSDDRKLRAKFTSMKTANIIGLTFTLEQPNDQKHIAPEPTQYIDSKDYKPKKVEFYVYLLRIGTHNARWKLKWTNKPWSLFGNPNQFVDWQTQQKQKGDVFSSSNSVKKHIFTDHILSHYLGYQVGYDICVYFQIFVNKMLREYYPEDWAIAKHPEYIELFRHFDRFYIPLRGISMLLMEQPQKSELENLKTSKVVKRELKCGPRVLKTSMTTSLELVELENIKSEVVKPEGTKHRIKKHEDLKAKRLRLDEKKMKAKKEADENYKAFISTLKGKIMKETQQILDKDESQIKEILNIRIEKRRKRLEALRKKLEEKKKQAEEAKNTVAKLNSVKQEAIRRKAKQTNDNPRTNVNVVQPSLDDKKAKPLKLPQSQVGQQKTTGIRNSKAIPPSGTKTNNSGLNNPLIRPIESRISSKPKADPQPKKLSTVTQQTDLKGTSKNVANGLKPVKPQGGTGIKTNTNEFSHQIKSKKVDIKKIPEFEKNTDLDESQLLEESLSFDADNGHFKDPLQKPHQSTNIWGQLNNFDIETDINSNRIDEFFSQLSQIEKELESNSELIIREYQADEKNTNQVILKMNKSIEILEEYQTQITTSINQIQKEEEQLTNISKEKITTIVEKIAKLSHDQLDVITDILNKPEAERLEVEIIDLEAPTSPKHKSSLINQGTTKQNNGIGINPDLHKTHNENLLSDEEFYLLYLADKKNEKDDVGVEENPLQTAKFVVNPIDEGLHEVPSKDGQNDDLFSLLFDGLENEEETVIVPNNSQFSTILTKVQPMANIKPPLKKVSELTVDLNTQKSKEKKENISALEDDILLDNLLPDEFEITQETLDKDLNVLKIKHDGLVTEIKASVDVSDPIIQQRIEQGGFFTKLPEVAEKLQESLIDLIIEHHSTDSTVKSNDLSIKEDQNEINEKFKESVKNSYQELRKVKSMTDIPTQYTQTIVDLKSTSAKRNSVGPKPNNESHKETEIDDKSNPFNTNFKLPIERNKPEIEKGKISTIPLNKIKLGDPLKNLKIQELINNQIRRQEENTLINPIRPEDEGKPSPFKPEDNKLIQKTQENPDVVESADIHLNDGLLINPNFKLPKGLISKLEKNRKNVEKPISDPKENFFDQIDIGPIIEELKKDRWIPHDSSDFNKNLKTSEELKGTQLQQKVSNLVFEYKYQEASVIDLTAFDSLFVDTSYHTPAIEMEENGRLWVRRKRFIKNISYMISEMEEELAKSELKEMATNHSFILYSDYRITFTSIEFRDWFLRMYVRRYQRYWVDKADIQILIVNGVAISTFSIKKIIDDKQVTTTIQAYSEVLELDLYKNMDYKADEILKNQDPETHMISSSKYKAVQEILDRVHKVEVTQEQKNANLERFKRMGLPFLRRRRMRMRILI